MSGIRNDVQQEALTKALSFKRCGLGISMGVGKTLIGLRYLQEIYNEAPIKFLIVAPKVSIFKSWEEEAEKFGIDEAIMANTTFSTYISLSKQDLDYDVLILDECHSLLYTHQDWLNQFKGRILGLTGTPPRWRNSEKGEMVEKFCPIVFKYIVDEAVVDNILNDYRIIIHKLYLDPKKNLKVENKGKVWFTSEFDSYEYWTRRVAQASTPKAKQIMSVLRMKAMMDFKSKEVYAKTLLDQTDEKCLVFANTIAQARRLCEYTYDSENPDSEDNLEKFSNGKLDKLACVLQLSEGVNIKNLKEGIILHAYGNERKSSQRIGRLLRLNPDECATVHILCYDGTIDEKWVDQALADFDKTKISFINQGEKLLNL